MQYKRLLFILILWITATKAQIGLKKVGQSTMNFQLVSVSPRASALGEAMSTLSTGTESMFFNPAGIVESQGTFDIKFYITNWIADIHYMAGAFTWSLGTWGSVGIHALNVDYGTIYGTSLLTPGEEEIYPAGYKDLGELSNVGAYSFGLSYGKAISTQFMIGGNLRMAGQNLGQNMLESGKVNNNAAKFVMDAGVKYYTGLRSFQFGMSIRNFSSNIKRERIYEQLPLTFAMGMAVDLFELVSPGAVESGDLLLAVDFSHPNNYSERMNVGLEYLFMGHLAVRGGYQFNQDIASWSAGFGLNGNFGGKGVDFDYSYSAFDSFDGVNRFAIGLKF
ncbi:MAG: PorV/PorQ family protein [Candidatus Marinimicrobia bacterium]|nr:PorV/PorQ family protein [Candidatus Neomarinimicrobiota bacterium]